MAGHDSVKFAEAHKKLRQAADKNPEWFDRARDVLRRSDDGSVLLLHALMDGLKEAYECGKSGKGLPPLRHVQSIAKFATGTEWRDEAQPAAAATRVRRAPPKAVVAQQTKPAPVRRVIRGAR